MSCGNPGGMENPQQLGPRLRAVTLHFCLLGVSWAHCFLLPFDVVCVREGSAALWAQAHTHAFARSLGCNQSAPLGPGYAGVRLGTWREGWGRRPWKNPSLSTELREGREGLPQPTRALPPVLPDGEKGATISLCLAEETETSDDPRGSLAGPWGSFSRLQCCCHLPALCVVPPSACALTNSQDTGLGTKSSRSSGWPLCHHSHAYCSQSRHLPEHRA